MIQFGTGGWREIIGDGFTKQNIQKIAKAVVVKMRGEPCPPSEIVIGYDRRFLSKEAMCWLGEVFASNGITPCLINKSSPTPLVMFYMEKHRLPYGLMVTASHNPAIYNGIKLFVEGGRDADEQVTNEIEEIIQDLERQDTTNAIRPYAELLEEGRIRLISPLNEYLDGILDRFDVAEIRRRSLKVVVDPLFGVSFESLNTVLATMRCEVKTLHNEHDTLFGGKMPSPTRETVRPLQNYMLDYPHDIGIATDGDADRIGVVDDKGRYLEPNDVLCLLYYYFLEYKRETGPVVKNLSTTHRLDKIASSYGQRCYEVPVGFKHITAKMRQVDALIGGESSGGLTVRGYIHGKDGIYAAVCLIEMLAKTGKSLSTLMDELTRRFGEYHMVERNLPFQPARKAGLIHQIEVCGDLPDFPIPIARISNEDGCKVYFENGGWVVLRFSGTEPLFRVFCEMQERHAAEAICEQIKAYYRI